MQFRQGTGRTSRREGWPLDRVEGDPGTDETLPTLHDRINETAGCPRAAGDSNAALACVRALPDILFNFAIIAFFIINLRPDESQPLNLQIAKANTCTCNYSSSLSSAFATFLKRQYDVELPRIVVDQPPNVGLGEYALPLSFELAKKLRKPPRKIAEEVVAGAGSGSRI